MTHLSLLILCVCDSWCGGCNSRVDADVCLTFLDDLECHCDHGHTTVGVSKSITSFRVLCRAGASVLLVPPCGYTPVVRKEVLELWNTLPLPKHVSPACTCKYGL